MSGCIQILLKAKSSKGTMELLRMLLPPSPYIEGEQRKAFYNVVFDDAHGRPIFVLEYSICGENYKEVKEKFLRAAQDDTYIIKIIKRNKEKLEYYMNKR